MAHNSEAPTVWPPDWTVDQYVVSLCFLRMVYAGNFLINCRPLWLFFTSSRSLQISQSLLTALAIYYFDFYVHHRGLTRFSWFIRVHNLIQKMNISRSGNHKDMMSYFKQVAGTRFVKGDFICLFLAKNIFIVRKIQLRTKSEN